MLKIIRGVISKTKRATYLKLKARVENHFANLGYSFQSSSTLGFNIFEISNTAFAFAFSSAIKVVSPSDRNHNVNVCMPRIWTLVELILNLPKFSY